MLTFLRNVVVTTLSIGLFTLSAVSADERGLYVGFALLLGNYVLNRREG